MRHPNWILAGENETACKSLESGLGLPPVVARLLANRGALDPESARLFLETPLESLEDPSLMADMDAAVDRVLSARRRKEKVVIYGDYDVDGITATATLIRFLRSIGVDTDFYIPERAKEGYGMNAAALDSIASDGAGLLITVDNGISDLEAVDHARSIGLDVLITDHHQPGAEIPSALAVLNPNRKDCQYPCKTLSGAGIAFKLCQAVRSALRHNGEKKENLPNLKRYLDMIAVSAIADLTPLTGENRTLARVGLREIAATDKTGLAALVMVTLSSQTRITARDVGYGLAPALNAAGRLGRADIGVELLLTNDRDRAWEIARFLESENKRRREIQDRMFAEALEMVKQKTDFEKDRAIALGSDKWHPGVAGIVASKIVNLYHLPTALVCFENGLGKGSARSIPAFNITDRLGRISDTLEKYGGHELAAGFSVKSENFEDFRDAFLSVAEKEIREEDLSPSIKIDMEVDPAIFTMDSVLSISALEPFGMGNPSPVFLSRDVRFADLKFIGREERHVRFSVNGRIPVVGFNMADKVKEAAGEQRLDIAYTPEISTWGGMEKIQLRLLDARTPC